MLSGCYSVPKVDLTDDSLSDIKVISVIRSPEPKEYVIGDDASLAVMFGIVGAMIGETMVKSKTEILIETMKKGTTTPFPIMLADDIVAALSRKGFEVKQEAPPWEWERKFEHQSRIQSINSDSDAILIIDPMFLGFDRPSAVKGYAPFVQVHVTLLGKDRQKILYRGFYRTGIEGDGYQKRRIVEPVAYFDGFDAITENPQKAAAAMQETILSISRLIVEDLSLKNTNTTQTKPQ